MRRGCVARLAVRKRPPSGRELHSLPAQLALRVEAGHNEHEGHRECRAPHTQFRLRRPLRARGATARLVDPLCARLVCDRGARRGAQERVCRRPLHRRLARAARGIRLLVSISRLCAIRIHFLAAPDRKAKEVGSRTVQ